MGKDLEKAITEIEKQFGAGAVQYLNGASLDVEKIPTGSLLLDRATGGGYPKGRIIEIYGPESGGKTTLTLHAIVEAQKLGLKCAFVDAEHALDPEYAKNVGVNINDLLISQPDSGEQALEVTEMLIRSGEIGLLVVDSVAALAPEAELRGEMGQSHVGLQARLMSQAMRKLTGVINQSNCLVIFINQIREKVGVMFGNPEITPGGRALKFYASQRVEIRRGPLVKNADDVKANIKIVKNKVSPPFKTCQLTIRFGIGLDKINETLDVGVELGCIKKGGAWYSYTDMKNKEHKWNGAVKFYAAMEENQSLFDEIRQYVEDNLAGL